MKAPRSGAVEENRIIVMEPRNPSVLREEAHTEQRKRERTFMIRRRLNSIISTTAITTTYLPTYHYYNYYYTKLLVPVQKNPATAYPTINKRRMLCNIKHLKKASLPPEPDGQNSVCYS